ncbi:putative reverse transcriptase domain-containing protein [Tanacetum coccineum]|uniref:Reverse transcriptase domain-containing protein n=1 Tax=Tanacetum coccineum TaxID=301880 RepID=A0ABQ4Y5H4_9ASTR
MNRSETMTKSTYEKLHFIEEPVEIMDREVKRLKQSRIPIVKVRWNSKRGPEYTWEREDQMQKKYPSSIMAASAIIISSDSSDESVGSPPSRVILFGDIPTVIPSTSVVAPETSTIAPVISSAAPVVETTLVASPTGLCGLVPYTGSDSDSPDEMTSPEHISPLPAISPFICTDSSEAPDSSDGPPSQDPYVATVARWRSRVTARTSSSHEFPIAPVTAPPGIRRRSATLIRPGEAIPFGRPYRTHLNGPRKLLTARKRVRPLPARRLASRHASPRSPDHHSSSSSSSSDSSPVHSLGLDAPDQAHSGSSTRDVSPRLCYPPRRAPRRSEAFRRWCAAPLSTLYPPTTSESSSGDSSERPMHSSPHSAGPSRKRCRSPVDSVSLSMPVTGSLAPTRADHLPPRKRFRDSYSSEASLEEDAEVGLTGTGVDMELGIGDGDEVGDTTEAGIDPMTAPLVEEEIVEPAGEDSPDSPDTRDGIVRSVEDTPVDLSDVVRKGSVDDARGRLRRLESVYLEDVSGYRPYPSYTLIITMTNTRSGMTHAAIEEMINQRVNAALEAHQVNQNLALGNNNGNGNGNNNGNGNGNDNGNGNGNNNGNGNGNDNGDGNENGNGNGNNGGDNGDGNENPNVNGRGGRLVARECTYQDFMKCQPTSFKGTEGVVGLIRWSEKMETVFHISNCPERYQVKYATCTLLDSALTWWNSHKRTIGTEAAYALSWRELMRLMTEVYCPRNEIQKMETELWNLSVEKTLTLRSVPLKVPEYHQKCTKMVSREEDRWRARNFSLCATEVGHIAQELQELQHIPQPPPQKGQIVQSEVVDYVLKDLPGLPPTRQVEFQIDLVPGAAPVARAPYRLAPSEMEELSTQLQELSDKGFIKTTVPRPGGATGFVCQKKDALPSNTKEEHDVHLRLILELLKKEELYAKFSKCDFWLSSVQFLGHVIDSKGIHVDPAKIESIKDWESPKTPTEIRQFLGLAGYYRRFIEGFSKISKPMTKLTQKSVKFNWGEKEETAFQTLKQKLCSAPILALPEGSENFIVYCDASHKGLGAMLMQREKVIAYASRQLKIYEKVIRILWYYIGFVYFLVVVVVSTGVSVSLGGGISSGGKKSQDLNISDSGNIRDGGKIGGEMASEAKRYLDKLSGESEEMFPGEAGK